jgi:hypothetical protein
MTVKQLIEKLQALPQEKQVCIFDHKYNLSGDWGEGSSIGIYTEFNAYEMPKDSVPNGRETWVALEFDNDMIDEDTDLDECDERNSPVDSRNL